jgi:large subunit ribosomal protein L10e
MGNNTGMAYTRQEYIHRIPHPRIVRFTMGDNDNDYDASVTLIASHDVDIRSRALEAARVTANRNLMRLLGDRAYFLQITPYPHEVIREHKFMGFAGADRLSQGMKLAFGRPTGRAARVRKGQAVLQVFVNQIDVPAVKTALARASKKLPLKYRITITDHSTTNIQEE